MPSRKDLLDQVYARIEVRRVQIAQAKKALAAMEAEQDADHEAARKLYQEKRQRAKQGPQS